MSLIPIAAGETSRSPASASGSVRAFEDPEPGVHVARVDEPVVLDHTPHLRRVRQRASLRGLDGILRGGWHEVRDLLWMCGIAHVEDAHAVRVPGLVERLAHEEVVVDDEVARGLVVGPNERGVLYDPICLTSDRSLKSHTRM